MNHQTQTTRTAQPTGAWTLTLLAALMIALRLTGHVDWPWWVVLSPLWAPWAVVFVVVLLLAARHREPPSGNRRRF